MKDYVTLNDKQRDFVIKKYISNWSSETIQRYYNYSWIIKYADSSWSFWKDFPYILGAQIPEADDPDFWETIGALNESEYEEIMEV